MAKDVQAVNKKEIFDRMRSQKLKNCLEEYQRERYVTQLRESQVKAIRLREQ